MRTAVVVLLASAIAFAAEEAPKSSGREALRARVAEDAKKAEAQKTSPAKTDGTAAAAAPKTSPAPASTDAKKSNQKSTANTPPPAKETPTVLPKVEVQKGRITELDLKIAQQERDIAREQKNTKSSEVDRALNDQKIAKPLSIFGGDSTQFRKGVASERVELMEAEKDILEAMKLAKTKEEKALLQKQLDELRAMRRELDKSMR